MAQQSLDFTSWNEQRIINVGMIQFVLFQHYFYI